MRNNATGAIVGQFFDGKTGITHGFRFEGGIVTMLDFPGATFTSCFGINDAGDIVGQYQTPDQLWHGFFLNPGDFTNFTSIDVHIPGFNYVNTGPNMINAAGSIVGSAQSGNKH